MTMTTALLWTVPRRRLVGLAWGLWGSAMLALAVTILLDQVLRRSGRPDLPVVTPDAIPPMLGAGLVVTVGVVLASRRPDHPVSWLLLTFGLSLSAAGATQALANYGVVHPNTTGAGVVVVYVPATLVIAIASISLALLLTPTGALLAPRWRWWASVTAATPVALLLIVALAPGSVAPAVGPVDSPFDLRALDGVVLIAYQAAFTVVISAFLVAAASLIVRFRRARGIERQQLRWVALATGVASLLAVANLAALALGAYTLAPLVGGLSPPILASAIGAAILRYRLYDLDRIISRTLAYGLLTLLLGLGYAGAVLGFGRLLPWGSNPVVAAATLAVAAAFQPARRSIQWRVDRRFNRRRHDAGQLIEAYGARLRDQVDLDSVTAELMAVVGQTMQPTQASLWMGTAAAGGRRSPVMPDRRARC